MYMVFDHVSVHLVVYQLRMFCAKMNWQVLRRQGCDNMDIQLCNVCESVAV
jgi:hypothetical protein